MNGLMGQMRTPSGLSLRLRWKSGRAEQEEQLDSRALVALLQKDAEIMREEEVEQLSRHFRSKIAEARKICTAVPRPAWSVHMVSPGWHRWCFWTF